MNLIINGQPAAHAAPMTLTQLVEALGLAGKRLAIELNGEIVPRSLHAQTQLSDGDRVEIVHAIGGG